MNSHKYNQLTVDKRSKSNIKKRSFGAGRLGQPIKCLSCKQKELSLMPSSHEKKVGIGIDLVTSALDRQRQEDL